ncbi:two component transcriptional regulator, LuxR family [Pelagirhabdus alkalitolerans]|uniref:Two component transcriptional regulator, LuxR family n=1 Tax=Pelagirhabdus alkalitolerans TaxID=1612202 RepID=A0A1G6JPF6_9BACI|nr:response regulator transcription factor [Pelagirhabdus alkalitolerans]SDC20642.1 two component transcriptional regulator, LuxR family [Pelagirhabdus alkalitolerans]
MIRILLAEDQLLVRQGLKMMIETEPTFSVVAEADNGIEAVRLTEKDSIDLVILDIRMPEMTGIEAAKQIRDNNTECKILMLTTFDDEEYALESLKVGANGYLLKSAESEELIRSIKDCLNGGLTIESQVAAKVFPKLMNETPKSKPIHPDLTDREIKIMCGIGKGLTNKEIAEQLYLSVGTVKNHISVILDKLDLRDRTQIAIYTLKHDLV